MKLFLISFLIATTCFAKTIRVAVIDTGLDFKSNWADIKNKYDTDGYLLRAPKLCKTGHTDFTHEGFFDKSGHGTHVAGIIAKFAENSNYCLIILKYFQASSPWSNMSRSNEAFRKAIELKVDMIN